MVKQSLEFANFFIGASCFISKIRSLMRAFSKIIYDLHILVDDTEDDEDFFILIHFCRGFTIWWLQLQLLCKLPLNLSSLLDNWNISSHNSNL